MEKARKKPTAIYVVDDSPMVQDRLQTLLAETPSLHVIGTAKDAHRAIKELEELSPEVVILDLQLAWGTGFDVLEKVKASLPGPLVIMLTNYAFDQFQKRALAMGADYFLDKSLEFDRIPDLILAFQQHAE